MARDPFWKSAKVLLDYKRQLAVLAVATILQAACYSGGIGFMLPLFALLVHKQGLHEFVQMTLIDRAPAWAPFLHSVGNYLIAHTPADRYEGFILLLGAIAILTLIGCVARYVNELVSITIASRATQVWRDRCYRRLIRVPIVQLGQTGSADYISRLGTDTRIVEFGYTTILGKPLQESCKAAGAVLVALVINWKLSMLAVIAAPLIVGLLRYFGKQILRAAWAALDQRGKMLGAMQEVLGGLGVVKVHNAEGYERRRFSRINQNLFREEMRMRQAKAISSPLVEFLTIIGVLVLTGVASYFIFQRNVAPEEFMEVLGALAMASGAVRPLSQVSNQLHESSTAAARVLQILDLPVEPIGIDDRRHAPLLPRHRRSVVFENVSFTYPGKDQPAVSGVSLDVPFGQTVAIVGGNGSGKTTLLHLLSRLLEPESGRVLIDGTDVAGVNLRSLRAQIAVVTQQSVLFEDSIANNIAYGRRWLGTPGIVAAAKAAFADEFITALPRGYETRLGEDGIGLSGGQRQRLCIARAVLRDPAILVLDEATSQIDADSEAKINQVLRSFRRGRTTFIIAHRLSTVIDADLIVVMDDGRVVDRGPHAELLLRCETYRILNQTQLRPGGV